MSKRVKAISQSMKEMKTMRVKEIFYSLQGEGTYTGRPAIFVRFSGCNLACPFCDTDFKGGDDYSEDSLIDEIRKFEPCKFVVFTGGEPTLQLTDSLIDKLHELGFFIAIETNGTKLYPRGIDWITVSPKNDFCANANLYPYNITASEVKVVYNGENTPEKYEKAGLVKYIQPCDTGDAKKNKEIIRKSVEWLKNHPDWRLSLQTQKIINVR